MARPLISVPARAKRGEVVEIKALVTHVMETGNRRAADGAVIPRDIIHLFTCTYNDTEVFRAEFFPAVAANPFVAFHTVATESGTLTFRWVDDHGRFQTASAAITVE